MAEIQCSQTVKSPFNLSPVVAVTTASITGVTPLPAFSIAQPVRIHNVMHINFHDNSGVSCNPLCTETARTVGSVSCAQGSLVPSHHTRTRRS